MILNGENELYKTSSSLQVVWGGPPFSFTV